MQEINTRLLSIEKKLSLLESSEKLLQLLETQNAEQNNLIHELEKQNQEQNNQLTQLTQENEKQLKDLKHFQHELLLAQNKLEHIQQSDFYRLGNKYYQLRDNLLPPGSLQRKVLKKAFKLLKKIRHKFGKKPAILKNQMQLLESYAKYHRMDIVTTKHTMFIAELLKHQLDRLSIECHIHVGEPKSYGDFPYIIVCPQFIKVFPKVYFVFQMEQTVSSRWFTPEYYTALENSCGILDYSLTNVEYFYQPEQHAVRSRVYYLPIDYLPGYAPDSSTCEKEYDVLFYGDPNNERRQRLLKEISKKYKVKICSEVFGEALYDEIRKCKVLINIHYYENALLETTRLYETLSLNTCVIVSEDSSDLDEVKRLEGIVDFVAIDDVTAMIERIGYWLEQDERREQYVQAIQKKLEKRANAFDYYFNRFLLAYDRITFDQFYQIAGDFFQIHTNRICLTLPESTKRRRSFDEDNQYGFECIPGLRHQKGWIGCGLSYKLIFKKALEANFDHVMICEDDVIFPKDFDEKLCTLLGYLNKQKHWNVFSGLLADAENIHVLKSEKLEKGYMTQVDHMVSMVFNIYNKSVFDDVVHWDEQDRNVQQNTIDRYLERQDLKIYALLPFLVGHKEELDSTIWGFSNIQYLEMIKNSEKSLLNMAENYHKE